jgi:hypothetical protein
LQKDAIQPILIRNNSKTPAMKDTLTSTPAEILTQNLESSLIWFRESGEKMTQTYTKQVESLTSLCAETMEHVLSIQTELATSLTNTVKDSSSPKATTSNNASSKATDKESGKETITSVSAIPSKSTLAETKTSVSDSTRKTSTLKN